MKFYWEIVTDNLRKRGWSCGYSSLIDRSGRTIYVADAHRDDGRRYVVHSDEKLTAFLELAQEVNAAVEAGYKKQKTGHRLPYKSMSGPISRENNGAAAMPLQAMHNRQR